MDVTHLGHSGLLVNAAGARILIDPGTFSELDSVQGVDAVCVTHQHADHLDPDRIGDVLGRSPGAVVHAEPQTAKLLRDRGVDAVDTAPGASFEVGGVTITAVGEQHAIIHDYIDRVGNLGLVLRAEGEPSLFHPGDALDAEPGEVDFLCVPVNAPWCAVRETIEFVRRVQPKQAIVPIHDALLIPPARAMYLGHIGGFGLDGGVEVRDLAGVGAQTL